MQLSASYVKQTDLVLRRGFVVQADRLRGRAGHDVTALLVEIFGRLGGEPYTVVLAGAENQFAASFLIDKLGFILGDLVRGSVIDLRQLFLALYDFPGEPK